MKSLLINENEVKKFIEKALPKINKNEILLMDLVARKNIVQI